MKYNKKKIMRRAWEIRREAAVKFGCKIGEISMSHCLTFAWAEAKAEAAKILTAETAVDYYCRHMFNDDYWADRRTKLSAHILVDLTTGRFIGVPVLTEFYRSERFVKVV